MRSRDGNHTFSLSICTIIFFHSLALHAGEYLISYRYLVKDTIVYNETLDISKAMHKCKGTPSNTLLLESHNSKNLKKIIALNNEKFIDYIYKLGLNVEHKECTTNLQNTSTTILILKTTCFKVDFNDNFAKISVLK
ncbi:hypothetical protein [Sulfurimonas autotrophica]|uniref:Uncharacterized protein n=1 Tax=Sulfurimonas autotrophica (strain ATCC BAA-671 / DSM 16294 / JCM 11897 / OK10) TaxID=563040 RepID=E0UQ40_SULAO|nr:hypothetical protein [Sulfurimonas autotrophica]ADN08715.1 conserved hypothetical protein [Sulfurimonas autotrophica DSM 16294]